MPRISEESLDLSMIGNFPRHWEEMTLSEVCIQVTDGTHDSPKEVAEGFPLVTGKAIKNRRIDFSIPYNISTSDHEKVIARSKPERGDILFANIGNSIGDLVRVQSDLEFSIKNVALFKPNQEIINPRYLEYYLFSNQIQSFIKNTTKGSAQPFIGLASLRGFPVSVPPKKEQDYIAKILGDLDDKIELNRQTNQTLEQIAQAIFKSWFVDFEPVKAKIKAKQSLSPALTQSEREQIVERAAMCAISGKTDAQLDQLDAKTQQQLKTTAALFPEALVDSELGEIPEGWGVGMMQDCCERVESGGTPKRSEESYWGGNVKWLSSGEVRDVIILDTKERISEAGLKNSSAKLWPKGSTVVAMYGATAGQVCLLVDEMTANQACCALIPKRNQKSYIFLVARRSIEELAGKASGSAQQNLNKSLVSEHKLLTPPDYVLTEFEADACRLIDKWQQNSEENVVLSELRDTLLPKLLSGELILNSDLTQNKPEQSPKATANA